MRQDAAPTTLPAVSPMLGKYDLAILILDNNHSITINCIKRQFLHRRQRCGEQDTSITTWRL